ncbi:hypothetical protein OH77DRAFT_156759 [Trametes cingulata]|nr:hypothetical protein OH77DRAFT_156759 [Trametes cingulata]
MISTVSVGHTSLARVFIAPVKSRPKSLQGPLAQLPTRLISFGTNVAVKLPANGPRSWSTCAMVQWPPAPGATSSAAAATASWVAGVDSAASPGQRGLAGADEIATSITSTFTVLGCRTCPGPSRSQNAAAMPAWAVARPSTTSLPSEMYPPYSVDD